MGAVVCLTTIRLNGSGMSLHCSNNGQPIHSYKFETGKWRGIEFNTVINDFFWICIWGE
jgi:hypothetical protein